MFKNPPQQLFYVFPFVVAMTGGSVEWNQSSVSEDILLIITT